MAVLSRVARKSAAILPRRQASLPGPGRAVIGLRAEFPGRVVDVSIKFSDLQAFTSEVSGAVPTTPAEKERIVQVLNHHRSERAAPSGEEFPVSDVPDGESRMSGIPR